MTDKKNCQPFGEAQITGEGNIIPCDYDCEANVGGVCYTRSLTETDNSKCEIKIAIDREARRFNWPWL